MWEWYCKCSGSNCTVYYFWKFFHTLYKQQKPDVLDFTCYKENGIRYMQVLSLSHFTATPILADSFVDWFLVFNYYSSFLIAYFAPIQLIKTMCLTQGILMRVSQTERGIHRESVYNSKSATNCHKIRLKTNHFWSFNYKI